LRPKKPKTPALSLCGQIRRYRSEGPSKSSSNAANEPPDKKFPFRPLWQDEAMSHVSCEWRRRCRNRATDEVFVVVVNGIQTNDAAGSSASRHPLSLLLNHLVKASPQPSFRVGRAIARGLQPAKIEDKRVCLFKHL
jgi:hypothetical protein